MPDPLKMLTVFLTSRQDRETELLDASHRNLERARAADRRAVAYKAALESLAELCDGVGCDAAVREIVADALADTQQADGAVRLAGDLLVTACHGASTAAGWWADVSAEDKHVVGTKLMLVVSEVAEAMEGHRKGLADDKLPHRPMIEVELADAVIRIADLAGALGLDLGGAIAEKMAFNATRPDHAIEARQAVGGKAY